MQEHQKRKKRTELFQGNSALCEKYVYSYNARKMWEIIIYARYILINIIISSLSFPVRNKGLWSSKSCPKLKGFLEENEKELESI